MPAIRLNLLQKLDLPALIDRSAVVHYLASPARPYPLIYVSASSESHTGFGPQQFTGSQGFWLRNVHPDDRERVLLARRAVTEGRTEAQEYRFQHASGGWRWIHDEVALVRDGMGEPFMLSGVWFDVTEHKQAEGTLEKQKAYAESLVANAPTIVLILDERGRILKVNPYFERKTGFTAAEVLHRDWFATMLHPDDQPKNQALFKEVLALGKIAGHVNPIVLRDGTLLEIEWFAQALTDSVGRFRGLLCIGHDVTERIGYERALEASKREAERANAAKSRFLVTASHDLRQPLQTLLLLNGALGRTAQDARQREMLDMQRQALKSMSSLLNSLLDIGKLECGAVEPQRVDLDIGALFARVAAELALQAQAKGLEFEIAPCNCVAYTDAELFTQLIRNVVVNAIRYTPAGSVRLACECAADTVRVHIADSGIGIPVDQREAIFDEFYQIDRGASRGGLGLGLSIVKRIAALLDITVEVASDLGNGSRFSFTVARGSSNSGAQAIGPGDRENRQGHGGTVLLVDDDPAVLAASRLFLEMEGYAVVSAASPAEARRALAAERRAIDLIITDYHLRQPETGLDIIASVRRGLGRVIPAIVVTGDTSPTIGITDIEGLELMSKPIDTGALLSLTQRMLASPNH